MAEPCKTFLPVDWIQTSRLPHNYKLAFPCQRLTRWMWRCSEKSSRGPVTWTEHFRHKAQFINLKGYLDSANLLTLERLETTNTQNAFLKNTRSLEKESSRRDKLCCASEDSPWVTDRRTDELILPWRGDVSAPLTSSADGCPLPWRPYPSANPRAPGTRLQTPADWRQRDGEREREITELNYRRNSIFLLLLFTLCFPHVLLSVIVSSIIVILFCPAAMRDICILLCW